MGRQLGVEVPDQQAHVLPLGAVDPPRRRRRGRRLHLELLPVQSHDLVHDGLRDAGDGGVLGELLEGDAAQLVTDVAAPTVAKGTHLRQAVGHGPGVDDDELEGGVDRHAADLRLGQHRLVPGRSADVRMNAMKLKILN